MKKSKIILGALGIIIMTYGIINVVSVTDPTTATIKTEIPMLATSNNVGLSLNGELTIIAPNTPGHWETEYGYFTSQKKVKFCPTETIGIQEFIFIPDNPDVKVSSVHSVVFVWRAHVEEIIKVIIIALIIAIYMNTKTSPASHSQRKRRKVTIT